LGIDGLCKKTSKALPVRQTGQRLGKSLVFLQRLNSCEIPEKGV